MAETGVERGLGRAEWCVIGAAPHRVKALMGKVLGGQGVPPPSVVATWLMMRWTRTMRTWMRRATSGRNSVM